MLKFAKIIAGKMKELYEILPFEKTLLEKRLPELTSEEIAKRLEFQRETMRRISITAIGIGLGITGIGTLMYLTDHREQDLPVFAAGEAITVGGGYLYYGARKAMGMLEGAKSKLSGRHREQSTSNPSEPPQTPQASQ